jgi:hypothetical protein
MDEPTSRISVSRDALRAELSEMELRLRIYFDDQLKHKADSAMVLEFALKFVSLVRGVFSVVLKRALESLVDDHLGERAATTWTRRERVLASLSGMVALSMLTLSVVAAFHGAPV